jgi:shikimate dehydrogenase
LVIDLIYNPAKTKFLEEAEKNGATILNGESMLKEQALKSWEIWTSK